MSAIAGQNSPILVELMEHSFVEGLQRSSHNLFIFRNRNEMKIAGFLQIHDLRIRNLSTKKRSFLKMVT